MMVYPVHSFRNLIILFGVCYLCYIFGFAIFLNGIISSSTSKLQSTPPQNLFKNCPHFIRKDICAYQSKKFNILYTDHYKKIILIVIDAFRADFISSVKLNVKFNLSMPFTEILLQNGSAISFVTRGFAPTVTLPRIKTLVTGTVSNFLDILLNFNAYELVDDNILKQASLNGLKSVFYGDNTWLKLFPNLFIRSEGIHSFFVSDFKEVDLNVSRHIKNEIRNEDWNILILHFLGVDHIGHAYGPFSKYLPPKLIEMDEIIRYIYEKSKILSHDRSLIIVCGDHGMTTNGGHGGTTEDELLTPLIFIDTANHRLNLKYKEIIDQVDFAPTLSVLLGLPIPANNFGRIIPDVLNFAGFSTEKILFATYYNFLQLANIYENFFPSETKHFEFARETTENHYKWQQDKINDTLKLNYDYLYILKSYEELLNNMKKDLLSVSTGYNESLMILGLTIMWVSLLFSVHILLAVDHRCKKILKILINQSFIFNTALFAIIAICTYYMHLISIIILFFISLLIFICEILFLLLNYIDKKYITFTGKVCMIFLFIHALSLFSSSYIEEEHQTWYYFTSSIIILLCCKKLYFSLRTWLINKKTHDLRLFYSECYSTIFCMFSILILHRLSCKWNQVGNKWQHLPDIADWLNQKQNAIYLSVLILVSQIILMFYFKKKLNSLNYILVSSGLVCITLQKLGNSGLVSCFNEYMRTMLMPWTVYIISVLIIISSLIQVYPATVLLYERIKNFILHFIVVWILLIEIIGRAHNIPLIAIIISEEYFLNKAIWRQGCSITQNVACYFIMAMTSFSYYGNSNSLSTVDVVVGYTGVQSYMPFIIAILLMCNTYSTMVLWLMLIPYRIIQLHQPTGDFENVIKTVKLTFLFLLDYKLFILSLYCIIMFLMRHHLFIYSVFFPKLCYECCHVILFSIICLIVNFMVDRA